MYAGTGINFANVAGDTFTGDGATTGFTLTHTPGTKHAIDVYLAGIWQHKSTFSISGTTLTFDVAPPDQVEIAVEYRGLPISIGTPANDSVGRAQIDVTSLGPVVQVVYTVDGDTTQSITTTTPASDDTIPQNTEGDEISTINTSITPKHASNILEVEVCLTFGASQQMYIKPFLVSDASANALSVGGMLTVGGSNHEHLILKWVGTADQTTARAFSCRVGVGSGTFHLNANSGGTAQFGGVNMTYMRITEYLVAN